MRNINKTDLKHSSPSEMKTSQKTLCKRLSWIFYYGLKRHPFFFNENSNKFAWLLLVYIPICDISAHDMCFFFTNISLL